MTDIQADVLTTSIRAEHLQQGHTLMLGKFRITVDAIMWDDRTRTIRLFAEGRTFRLFYDTTVDIYTLSPGFDNVVF
ncbi:hypothetical protein VI01_21725 [Pantoea sp. SM3]|nr:hypothetical protein VI01_21725 [Pantoea sp. SM3]